MIFELSSLNAYFTTFGKFISGHFPLDFLGPVIVQGITPGSLSIRRELNWIWLKKFLLKECKFLFQRAEGRKNGYFCVFWPKYGIFGFATFWKQNLHSLRRNFFSHIQFQTLLTGLDPDVMSWTITGSEKSNGKYFFQYFPLEFSEPVIVPDITSGWKPVRRDWNWIWLKKFLLMVVKFCFQKVAKSKMPYFGQKTGLCDDPLKWHLNSGDL